MTYGSLFSGIGGMDLGLDRAGMECKWQVEIAEHLLDRGIGRVLGDLARIGFDAEWTEVAEWIGRRIMEAAR